MANELNMTLFSKRLKEARTDKNMTQKELSEKSGVSTVMISAYERSNTNSGKNPALNNIYAIATALDVSIDWLCGLTNSVEYKKDNIEIDTETLLYSIIELLNSGNLDITTNYDNNEFNKEVVSSYIIEIGKYGGELVNFITDYLDVQNIIKKQILPKGLDKTLTKTIVEKYKHYQIVELISDLPF